FCIFSIFAFASKPKIFGTSASNPNDNGMLHRSIYQDLMRNTWHFLVVLSIGAIPGGLLMIYAVHHVSLRKVQLFGFVMLTVFLLALGFCSRFLNSSSGTTWTLATLYIVCEFLFELGPNFTTSIVPAELFLTKFRGT